MKKFTKLGYKLTLGSTTYTDAKLTSADIVRVENGYDTATLNLDNYPNLYPSILTNDSTTTLTVKDTAKEANYTTIFNGKARFPKYQTAVSPGKIMIVKADGAGYPLSRMIVAEEYWYQSRMSTSYDTISEVTADIIDNWVEKNLDSANNSGYTIDTTNVAAFTETFPYICFNYKPANKCLDDLIDLQAALDASHVGAHWIVDTSSNLRMKELGATQSGWTKYYGDSQAAATLTSTDLIDASFEPFGKEANQIVYYGLWRRPSSGDAWTEAVHDDWGSTNATMSDDNTAGRYMVDGHSLKALNDGSGQHTFYYPSTQDADWNFNVFKEFEKPTLNFWYMSRDRTVNFAATVALYDSDGDYILCAFTSTIAADDTWYHIELPIGPFYKNISTSHTYTFVSGTPPDWSDIQYIKFGGDTNGGESYVDGLYFGGAGVCRVAREAYSGEDAGGTLGAATNPVRTKVITDDVGKDDSLIDADDSGLLAQLACSELYRCKKTGITGTITTTLLPDLLPGQFLYYDSKDWRVTKITHHIAMSGCTSTMEITDDVTNSHARPAYEDVNKLYSAIRPEYQDRQASNLKSGKMDIRTLRLTKYYTT